MLALATRDGLHWCDAGRAAVLTGRSVTCVVRVGDTLVAGMTNGVALSADRGHTWRELDEGLGEPHVRWLADGGTPGLPRLLAGTEPAAIWRTDDLAAWTESSGVTELRDEHSWFLPYSPQAGCVRGFAHAGERVYAAVEVGGLLRSDEGGRRWRLAGGSDGVPTFGEPASGAIHPDVHSVHVHPSSADHVLAATAGGLYVSTDGGDRWERRTPVCYTRDLWVDPADPDHIVLGVATRVGDKQGRIERTRDGGRTWGRDPGAEGPWPAAMVERFAPTADTLVAVRSDGRVLEQRADDPWRDVAGIADGVRAVCEVPD
jgi:hypothetical protein